MASPLESIRLQNEIDEKLKNDSYRFIIKFIIIVILGIITILIIYYLQSDNVNISINGNGTDKKISTFMGSYDEDFNNNDETIMVTFHFADWCPHCVQMKPVWHNVKKYIYSGDAKLFGKDIIMKEIDEVASPTPGIKGYPTILKNGKKYKGPKDERTLREWILE